MKKFALTLTLSIFSLVIYAQAPKGTNKIIVINSKSASDNFLAVKQQLAENSIAIASQDKDIFQIVTGNIPAKSGANYQYIIFCKEKSIAITGKFTTGIEMNWGFGITAKDDEMKIVNKGMSGSIFKKAFTAMEDFAKSLGGEITYGAVIKEVKVKKDDAY